MARAHVPKDKSVRLPSLYATLTCGIFAASTLIGKTKLNPNAPPKLPKRHKTTTHTGAIFNSVNWRPKRRVATVIRVKMMAVAPDAKLIEDWLVQRP